MWAERESKKGKTVIKCLGEFVIFVIRSHVALVESVQNLKLLPTLFRSGCLGLKHVWKLFINE